MASLGAAGDLLDSLRAYDPLWAHLSDVPDERRRPFARTIVFDALRTARSDGVSARERALAERAAEHLRLDPTFVVAIENQLEIERAVREARMHLLAPVR